MFVTATYLSLAVTNMRADLPSGKAPTTRVRLLADEHAHAAQPAGPQPGQELPPALRRPREALGNAEELTASLVETTARLSPSKGSS